MKDIELYKIKGGASFSAAVVNALVRTFNLALELGRTLGSSIKRKIKGQTC